MEPHCHEPAPGAMHPSERCAAPACLYAIVRALIEELSDRRHTAKFGMGQHRQLAALNGLAEQMIAVLTAEPPARSPQMFEELHRRFRRAQRCTDRGTPIEQLLTLAQPALPGRFRPISRACAGRL